MDFSVFPFEIYIEIFSFLENGDLCCFSLVCKRFWEFSKNNIIWGIYVRRFLSNNRNYDNLENTKSSKDLYVNLQKMKYDYKGVLLESMEYMKRKNKNKTIDLDFSSVEDGKEIIVSVYGRDGIGKSSLLRRLLGGDYVERSKSRRNTTRDYYLYDHKEKVRMKLEPGPGGKSVFLRFEDTTHPNNGYGGRIMMMTPLFSDFYIVCVNLGDVDSLDYVFGEICEQIQNEGKKVLIVGTKCDETSNEKRNELEKQFKRRLHQNLNYNESIKEKARFLINTSSKNDINICKNDKLLRLIVGIKFSKIVSKEDDDNCVVL